MGEGYLQECTDNNGGTLIFLCVPQETPNRFHDQHGCLRHVNGMPPHLDEGTMTPAMRLKGTREPSSPKTPTVHPDTHTAPKTPGCAQAINVRATQPTHREPGWIHAPKPGSGRPEVQGRAWLRGCGLSLHLQNELVPGQVNHATHQGLELPGREVTQMRSHRATESSRDINGTRGLHKALIGDGQRRIQLKPQLDVGRDV